MGGLDAHLGVAFAPLLARFLGKLPKNEIASVEL
jgi:hypothetical protein